MTLTITSSYTDNGYKTQYPHRPIFQVDYSNVITTDIYMVRIVRINSDSTETIVTTDYFNPDSTNHQTIDPGTWITTGSTIYNGDAYRYIVRYLDYNYHIISAETADWFEVRGKAEATTNDPVTAYTPEATYMMLNEHTIQVTVSENHTSSSPGTFLESMDGTPQIVLQYSYSGKAQSSSGIINKQSSSYIEIRQATSGTIGQMYRTWVLVFKQAGTYTLTPRATYCTRATQSNIYTSTRTGSSLQIKVYGPSKPLLKIDHVTAVDGTHTTGDTTNSGAAPFQVQFIDKSLDSTIGDPYQIPQQNIVVEFGDPDSKTNILQINNPGATAITIPTSSLLHSYPDYRSRGCSITVTDKNGRITSGRVIFAPDATPRVIPGSPPKLNNTPPGTTVRPGEQPALVTGQAWVAGDPEPTVTWKYTLGSSSYYTGEKEGTTAELSLLASGSYTITCEIKNNAGTIINTYSWAVVVDAAATRADTPITGINDFEVWIFNTNGDRVGILDPATRAEYIDRYDHEKYCEFQIPINSRHAQYLRRGALLAFGYQGKARLMIVNEYIEDTDGGTLTIGAVDAAGSLFEGRVAIIATSNSSDAGYDTQKCSGEALMRYYAQANLKDPGQATNYRAAPGFKVIGTNQDRPVGADPVVYSARFETTAEIMDDLCSASGLGWDITMQTPAAGEPKLVVGWKVIQGVDRTIGNTAGNRPVYFTEDNCTAKVGPYSEYLGPTVAITAGEGAGSSREYLRFGAPTVSGFARREIFVDASDCNGSTEMEQKALSEIESEKEQSITIEPTGRLYSFGTDYTTGDFVTVKTKSGLDVNLQINQATATKDSSGIHITLQLGTDRRNQQTLMRRIRLANTYAKK